MPCRPGPAADGFVVTCSFGGSVDRRLGGVRVARYIRKPSKGLYLSKRNKEPGRAEMLAERRARRAEQRVAEGLPPLETMSKGARRRERLLKVKAERVARGMPAAKPCNQYDTYISSARWRNRRREYFATHRRECAGCGATQGIALHHKTYVRKGAELDADLVPVCQPCHTAIDVYHKAKKSGSLAANTDIVLEHVRSTGKPGSHPLQTSAQR